MEIIENEKLANKAHITVSINQNDIEPEFQKKLKDYAKKAHLKGFRPGKVPPGIIEKMYGKELKTEVINDKVQQLVSDYMQSHNLNILGDVLMTAHPAEQNSNWLMQDPLQFEFKMAYVPDFETPDLQKLELVYADIQVDDKRVEEYIEKMRLQYGEEVEAQNSDDDSILYVTVSVGDWSGKAVLSKKDFKGQTSLFDAQPIGYTETINLSQEVDEKVLKHLFKPEEFEKLTEGQANVTIEKIKNRQPAELNTDFYLKITGKADVDTYEKFIEHIRTLFKTTYDEEAKNLLKVQLRKKLPKLFTAELAEDLLKDMLRSNSREKMDSQSVEQNFPNILEEIKFTIIRDRLLNENGFELNDRVMEEGAKALMLKEFSAMGLSVHSLGDDFLDRYAKSYLTMENGKNVPKVRDHVVSEKLLEIIQEKGNFVTKKVTIDELNQMVENLLSE